MNALRERLLAGEMTEGLWLGFGEAYAAEIAATAGFDWLLIDGEHGPNDLRSISAQLGVLWGRVPAVVRPASHDPAVLKQLLDLGAQSLLIPMVETAEEARALVRATRYPPRGIRGMGSDMARASLWTARKDYVTQAESELLLLLQVETRAGLDALDAILAVEGVDGVFIGPADLAADMGLAGQGTHEGPAPQVRDAVLDALARTERAGRIAGVFAAPEPFVQACRDAGARFIGRGGDVVIFAQALRALAPKR